MNTRRQKFYEQIVKTKVLENYTFMTGLHIFSALIALLLYPYVIRRLGADSYGQYAFALSAAAFVELITDYGFDSIGAKFTVDHRDDPRGLQHLINCIFTGKCLLFVPSVAVYTLLVFTLPLFKSNPLLFLLAAAQVISCILYPNWYFQGLKRMRVVTLINLTFRLLQVPAVLLFVRTPADNVTYMFITSVTYILGGLTTIIYLRIYDHMRLRFVSLKALKPVFRDGLPFFEQGVAVTLKEHLLTLFIGSHFGMRDVALWDLANKIIRIPRMFTQNINSALFPEVATGQSSIRIGSVLRHERLVALLIMLGIAAAGYPLTLLLGGHDLIAAYPIACVLSVTIFTWLLAGVYLSLLFVPAGLYRLVARNQLLSLVCTLGAYLVLFRPLGIYAPAVAVALGGICEVIYCRYAARRNQLIP